MKDILALDGMDPLSVSEERDAIVIRVARRRKATNWCRHCGWMNVAPNGTRTVTYAELYCLRVARAETAPEHASRTATSLAAIAGMAARPSVHRHAPISRIFAKKTSARWSISGLHLSTPHDSGLKARWGRSVAGEMTDLGAAGHPCPSLFGASLALAPSWRSKVDPPRHIHVAGHPARALVGLTA